MRRRAQTVAGLIAACVAASAPRRALAQQDTTPPIITGFTISPTTFDSGLGPVILTACVSAQDDLSGLQYFVVMLCSISGCRDYSISESFVSGSLTGTACGQTTVP